jgi:hypothetical protein
MPRGVQELVTVRYVLRDPEGAEVQRGEWSVRRAAIYARPAWTATPAHGLGIFEWEGRRHIIRGHSEADGVESYDVEGVLEPIPTSGRVTVELTDAEGATRGLSVDVTRLYRRDGQLLLRTQGVEVSLVYALGRFHGSV